MDSVITTQRIPVTVTYNFREVSGIKLADGVLPPRRLYRSDALHKLDEGGRELLGQLGVTQIVDLRDKQELVDAPSQVDGLAGVTRVHNPILDPDAAPAHWGQITLDMMYEHMIDNRGEQIVQAIRRLANTEGASLVHCTAGKDRTGVVVAFTLMALGASRDDVIENYALTESNLAGAWLEDMLAQMARFNVSESAELIRMVGSSPAELMEATLSRAELLNGSVVEYLKLRGLTRRDFEALQTKLLN